MERIRNEAETCGVFVAILSRKYFQRYWCMHELDLALTTSRHVVPVYYGRCFEPDDLPQEKVEFCKYFEKISRVDQNILDRWWININQKLPGIQDFRMCSYAKKKRVEVEFKKDVAARIRELLLKKE